MNHQEMSLTSDPNNEVLAPEVGVCNMNGSAKDPLPEEVKNMEKSNISDHKIEETLSSSKPKKRRRSSALSHLVPDSSPDSTSRYRRSRKPKLGDEDFLPTEAVLANFSPKKGKKSLLLSTPPSVRNAIKLEDEDQKESIQDPFDPQKVSSDEMDNVNETLNASNNTEESEEENQEIVTEFEPGDLIWGRLGNHPFWPCIIINDPVDFVYFKTRVKGRGVKRILYHVLFYGDNGKRSWVPSNMILRFIGLQDFEVQAAAITPEMRKKDPKWCSGFFVKTTIQPRWEAAAREAEAVMPFTRDERLDAFLQTMPQKKGKRPQIAEDADDLHDTETDERDGSSERESTDSPSSGKKKKKLKAKGDSPPTEKKKRGRPRKIVTSSNLTDQDSNEPVGKRSLGRPPKRKLVSDVPNLKQEDDTDSKTGTKKRRKGKKKEKKSVEDKAFALFVEKHLDSTMDHNSNMTVDDAKKYLRVVWDGKDEEEHHEYITLVSLNDGSEEDSFSEDDDNGQDDTGVEEEVAAVASADSAKEEASQDGSSVVTSKKKINLFRGYKMERVCQVCEKAGNTVKCRGGCGGVFHVECARGADNSVGVVSLLKEGDGKPKKRGRKKIIPDKESLPPANQDQEPLNPVNRTPKPKVGIKRRTDVYVKEESDSDLDYFDGETVGDAYDEDAIMKMIVGNTSSFPEVSMLTLQEIENDDEDSEQQVDEDVEEVGGPLPLVHYTSISDFRCGDCAVFRTPLCFICSQATDPSGEDSVRIRCSVGHCGKHYHIECLKVLWPQASYSSKQGVIQNLTCPQHVCHTCVSDNPRDCEGRFYHEKLVRCIRCPTSYHYGNYCVPAGSKILTATQIICPRHYEPLKTGPTHVNASWCFICSIGGSLICCDLCPSSFHVDCLKIKPPTGGYICEDCETGRYPLYNEVLWVKLGNYRWWPAISLFPSEVPHKMMNRPHKLGEFAVRFLGTKDHYWMDRGRCFIYHEGDCVKDAKKTSKTGLEGSYQQGVLEANELHKAHKEIREKMQNQSKPGASVRMKPPQYVKIKTNKPVGSVKMLEVDTSTISPCDCNANSEHPCGPDSECLNRMLMQECDPETCPAGEKCENQYFEKRIYPALAPYRTEGRGWGLQVLEDIKKGSFVIEYVGEVIDDEEYQRRLQKKHEEKDENYYFLTIDSFRMIDAGPKGNVSRFMNHSCQPNCQTQKWNVAGETRVGLFALCDIPAGTELTFNYNLESKGNEKKVCMCGTEGCSGFIGAKKNKVPQPDAKELTSSGKKKRRKPRVRNLHEDICLLCGADREVGHLISCINKECFSRYHLTCIGLTAIPIGKWLCPRHRCNVCQKRTQQWCSYCTESFCPAHLGDNLVNDPLHGNICEAHQKNPLSIDYQKKKREEERKQKEEEKRKQDELERANRRSRRELVSNEDDPTKPKSSDLEDRPSDGQSEDSIRTSSIVQTATESALKNRVSENTEDAVIGSPQHELTKKRRGRKEKVTAPETENLNSQSPQKVEKDAKDKALEKDSFFTETSSKSGLDEESHVSSSVLDDSGKDEIPDADPALDKFIVQTPAPIDDESEAKPEEHLFKEKKVLDKPVLSKPISGEPSPSSVTKRRRQPPMHRKDYVSSLSPKLLYLDSSPTKAVKTGLVKVAAPKNAKGVNHGTPDLSSALDDIATGFASDDGDGSPRNYKKKLSTRGRGRRPSLGIVRSHMADSTTNETSDTVLEGNGESKILPLAFKSPKLNSPPGSAELSAGKLLAMQRARGLKVMPPNRRLSLAREQALGVGGSDELSGKVERLGKGIKVLKGRRLSTESSSVERRMENSHSEVLQSGVSKKSRPVLSKVQDNGVSVEDGVEEKVVENSSLSLPKQPLPHPMQSPSVKKTKTLLPKKQSPSIGISSLWNQDIFN